MCSRLIFEDIFGIKFSNGRTLLGSRNRYFLSRLLMPNWYKNRLLSTAASGTCIRRTMLSFSPRLTRVLFSRSYQRHSNPVAKGAKVWRKRLWTIVRGIFLTTGGLVWMVAFLAYLSLEKVSVDVHEERSGLGLNELERKLMSHFYGEKDEAGIMKKDDALDRVWRKLNQEERIKEIFGHPVYICGYNYSNKIRKEFFEHMEVSANKPLMSEQVAPQEVERSVNSEKGSENEVENSRLWEAGCYIEGSKKVGLLKVKFEEHKREWVPVALHLETLEKSGHVVSDVSASLPNGIKNFTRLSN